MDPAKKMEEEAKVHRIRITLTSRSIKDLEKVRSAVLRLSRAPPACAGHYCPPRRATQGRGGALQLQSCSVGAAQETGERCSFQSCSAGGLTRLTAVLPGLRGPHPWRQGEAPEGQGPRPPAHQDPPHHHAQVAVR